MNTSNLCNLERDTSGTHATDIGVIMVEWGGGWCLLAFENNNRRHIHTLYIRQVARLLFSPIHHYREAISMLELIGKWKPSKFLINT